MSDPEIGMLLAYLSATADRKMDTASNYLSPDVTLVFPQGQFDSLSQMAEAMFGALALAASVGIIVLVMMKKRRFAGIAIVIAFGATLSSCGAMPGVELFNLQLASGTPLTGAIYSTDVVVTADPDTYSFRFIFTTGPALNTEIPDDDIGTWGPASGWMTFDIVP